MNTEIDNMVNETCLLVQPYIKGALITFAIIGIIAIIIAITKSKKK